MEHDKKDETSRIILTNLPTWPLLLTATLNTGKIVVPFCILVFPVATDCRNCVMLEASTVVSGSDTAVFKTKLPHLKINYSMVRYFDKYQHISEKTDSLR